MSANLALGILPFSPPASSRRNLAAPPPQGKRGSGTDSTPSRTVPDPFSGNTPSRTVPDPFSGPQASSPQERILTPFQALPPFPAPFSGRDPSSGRSPLRDLHQPAASQGGHRLRPDRGRA